MDRWSDPFHWNVLTPRVSSAAFSRRLICPNWRCRPFLLSVPTEVFQSEAESCNPASTSGNPCQWTPVKVRTVGYHLFIWFYDFEQFASILSPLLTYWLTEWLADCVYQQTFNYCLIACLLGLFLALFLPLILTSSTLQNRSALFVRRYGRKHRHSQSSQRHLEGKPSGSRGRRAASPSPPHALPPSRARELRHRRHRRRGRSLFREQLQRRSSPSSPTVEWRIGGWGWGSPSRKINCFYNFWPSSFVLYARLLVCISARVYFCPSVFLPVFLSVGLSVGLSFFLSVCLSACICLSFCHFLFVFPSFSFCLLPSRLFSFCNPLYLSSYLSFGLSSCLCSAFLPVCFSSLLSILSYKMFVSHKQHPTSSTTSAKSFTKKRGEGKTSERRDSKSSSSSSQNANNALPVPSRSMPQPGKVKILETTHYHLSHCTSQAIDVWEGASGASHDAPRSGLKSNSVSNARKKIRKSYFFSYYCH